jgi:hypothetical protein
MLDHDSVGTRNRRRHNRNRGKRRDDVTRLLHIVLLILIRIKLRMRGTVPMEPEEISEQPFSLKEVMLRFVNRAGGGSQFDQFATEQTNAEHHSL